MALGLDCAEGKCDVCSGTATCSQYRDGCRDCACLCGCHIWKTIDSLLGEFISDYSKRSARRLIESSRECLTTDKYGKRLGQIDFIEKLLVLRESF